MSKGVPVDGWCEEGDLSVGERLELILRVCSALSFAYQNLVVLRDLEPGNILVTPDGSPKLLDFGIAKLLEPGDDTKQAPSPTHTVTGLMTPHYGSPEQLRGEPATKNNLFWVAPRRARPASWPQPAPSQRGAEGDQGWGFSL